MPPSSSRSEEYGTFSDHLLALQRVLLLCAVVIGSSFFLAFWYVEELIALLTSLAMPAGSTTPSTFLLLHPLEGFVVAMQVALATAAAFSLPLTCWLLFRFVAPACHAGERHLLLRLLAWSFGAGLLGLWIGCHWLLPQVNHWLLTFNASFGINQWSLEAYVDYALGLLLAMILMSEAITTLLLAVHYRLVTTNQLTTFRRYWILFSLIFGAIATPPDVLSQLVVAIPMIACYETAWLYSLWRQQQNAS